MQEIDRKYHLEVILQLAVVLGLRQEVTRHQKLRRFLENRMDWLKDSRIDKLLDCDVAEFDFPVLRWFLLAQIIIEGLVRLVLIDAVAVQR